MKNGEIIIDDFLEPLKKCAEAIEKDQKKEKGDVSDDMQTRK